VNVLFRFLKCGVDFIPKKDNVNMLFGCLKCERRQNIQLLLSQVKMNFAIDAKTAHTSSCNHVCSLVWAHDRR